MTINKYQINSGGWYPKLSDEQGIRDIVSLPSLPFLGLFAGELGRDEHMEVSSQNRKIVEAVRMSANGKQDGSS